MLLPLFGTTDMSYLTHNVRLAIVAVTTWILAFLVLASIATAAPVTFSDVQQTRNPVGPISPPNILGNELRLSTPAYDAIDDGISVVDEDVVRYRGSFTVEASPGEIIPGFNFLQTIDFDFGAPFEASNFVRTESVGVIFYTEFNGVPVNPADPANQQVFTLDRLFRGSDLPGTGSVDVNIPLPAGLNAFDVEFDNTLIAFSVEDTARIVARDIRISVATAAVPEPGSLGLICLAGASLVGLRRYPL